MWIRSPDKLIPITPPPLHTHTHTRTHTHTHTHTHIILAGSKGLSPNQVGVGGRGRGNLNSQYVLFPNRYLRIKSKRFRALTGAICIHLQTLVFGGGTYFFRLFVYSYTIYWCHIKIIRTEREEDLEPSSPSPPPLP